MPGRIRATETAAHDEEGGRLAPEGSHFGGNVGLIAAHGQAVFPVETLHQAGDKAATEELRRLKQVTIDKFLEFAEVRGRTPWLVAERL